MLTLHPTESLTDEVTDDVWTLCGLLFSSMNFCPQCGEDFKGHNYSVCPQCGASLE